MQALALTDDHAVYGHVPFSLACQQAGIHPIFGCVFTVPCVCPPVTEKEHDTSAEYAITVLAQTAEGYRNVLQLSTLAHAQPTRQLTWEQLCLHATGLIVLSGGERGEVIAHLRAGRLARAQETMMAYRAVFGDRYYVELMHDGTPEAQVRLRTEIALAQQCDVTPVATNNVHYVHPQEVHVQQLVHRIRDQKPLGEERTTLPTTGAWDLKREEEMLAQFDFFPQAVYESAKIAQQCVVSLPTVQGNTLPTYPHIPKHIDSFAFLRQLCVDGACERYAAQWEHTSAAIQQRVQYELTHIQQMGYVDYFLITWDVVAYAHRQGIAIGPGRGSVNGSVVAYVLRITDVDPLRYGLVFERFLHPDRITLPDIDMDFEDARREELIGYVAETYGRDHVAQIVTFGTFGARGALRDSGRILGVSPTDVQRMMQYIPVTNTSTLHDIWEQNASVRQWCAQHPRMHDWFDLARQIEGLPRHTSTHAAGVVISKQPLAHITALQAGKDVALTQMSMEQLAVAGLCKIDFLGLRTLTILRQAMEAVRMHAGVTLSWDALSLDDAHTYAMLCRGETEGVFQLESSGMRNTLKALRPSCFEDLISVIALYRPGPMSSMETFIAAKHGRIAPSLLHPALDFILEETYGVMVYQEQMMRLAVAMAGFTWAQADTLRRAVSKKNHADIEAQRRAFFDGCQSLGYSFQEAQHVFAHIAQFARYAFPRAHAVAYAMLAYRTAYVKAHYPVQWFGALLNAHLGRSEHIARYVESCRKQAISILPPDVNESTALFALRKGDDGAYAICFGLGAIRHVSTAVIQTIEEHRQKNGAFRDLLDFCQRIDVRRLTKKVLESLIYAGALDRFPGHRAQWLAVTDTVLAQVSKWQHDQSHIALHTLGLTPTLNAPLTFPQVPPLSMEQMLEKEREVLGLYVSGHPLDAWETSIVALGVVPIHRLDELEIPCEIVCIGQIKAIKTLTTKAKKMMAVLTIEDRLKTIEVVIFPDRWVTCQSHIALQQIKAFTGKLEWRGSLLQLLVSDVYDPDDPALLPPTQRSKQKKEPPPKKHDLEGVLQVVIKIQAQQEKSPILQRLHTLLRQHPGKHAVLIHYVRTGQTLQLSAQYHVDATPALMHHIVRLFGKGAVQFRRTQVKEKEE
jgi:DNA polymerase-3 subunit alpha